MRAGASFIGLGANGRGEYNPGKKGRFAMSIVERAPKRWEGNVVLARAKSGPDPRPRLWICDEFHRMGDFGVFGTAHLMLIDGVLLEQNHGDPNWSDPRPYRFTAIQYERLHDLGLLEGQRVMLIDGIVYQDLPMKPPHATAIRKSTKTLEAVFPTGFDVRVQLPLIVVGYSDPHPDFAVVLGSFLDFAAQHPMSAVLIVEVSDSSLLFDQTQKASLYAAGAIVDYWIVDLVNRRLEVRRDPRPDATQHHGFGYADVKVFAPGEAVAPLAMPTASVAVNDLLP